MANPHPTPNLAGLRPFHTNPNPIRVNYRSQTLAVTTVVFDRIMAKKTKAVDLIGLARVWCSLMETVRIMRGVPLPGQLRPDLDPVQMMKAIKRARSRGSIDIGSRKQIGFHDEDGEPTTDEPKVKRGPGRPRTPKPAADEPATPTEPEPNHEPEPDKESLSAADRPHTPQPPVPIDDGGEE
jgi:hypothetical protein